VKYYDCHTHVNFAAFSDELPAVMRRAEEAQVGMNIVGTQLDTSRSAVEVAERYEYAWATVGLHPIHTSRSYHDEKELGEGGKTFTSRGEIFDAGAYTALAQSHKVVAIGECGLDYYRLESDTKKMQEAAFIEQIHIANMLKKPLMLHVRPSPGTQDAYDDVCAIVRREATVRGDVHFFAGSWETARRFLELGFTLSFTGVLTFTRDYDEIVKNTPLDTLLSETDAPYITPVPHRGTRNEPAYVPLVVSAIAGIRGQDQETVAATLAENARRVFGFA
jgi:TatD DNase family protein